MSDGEGDGCEASPTQSSNTNLFASSLYRNMVRYSVYIII